MNWNIYVSRRKIDVKRWLEMRDISDRDSFLKILSQLNIVPPDDDQMLQMFPISVIPKIDEAKNEPATHTTERSDQTATRSVAGEGNGNHKRSDRKRASKVRS